MDKARETLEPSPLQRELAAVINRHCAENGSDTPDFVLGRFLIEALQVFDNTTRQRDEWWGFQPWQRQPEPPRAPPREPTKEMIAAALGMKRGPEWGDGWYPEPVDYWRAMYDAAPAAEPVAQQPEAPAGAQFLNAANPQTILALLAASHERAAKLHEALRRHAIAGALGAKGGHCRECWGFGGREWGSDEPEFHAEGCLAAPSAPKDTP